MSVSGAFPPHSSKHAVNSLWGGGGLTRLPHLARATATVSDRVPPRVDASFVVQCDAMVTYTDGSGTAVTQAQGVGFVQPSAVPVSGMHVTASLWNRKRYVRNPRWRLYRDLNP